MNKCAGCGRHFPNLASLLDHHPRRCYKLRHGRVGPGPHKSDDEYLETAERQRAAQLEGEAEERNRWAQIYGRNH